MSGCDCKSRQRDTFNRDRLACCFRQSRRIGRKIDDHEYDRLWLVGHLPDTQAMDFDQSGKFGHWSCQKTLMNDFEPGSIVGHETCECEPPLFGRLQQREGKPRFARPGRTADQNGARSDQHSRRVDRRGYAAGRIGIGHYTAGKRSVNRAPSTRS